MLSNASQPGYQPASTDCVGVSHRHLLISAQQHPIKVIELHSVKLELRLLGPSVSPVKSTAAMLLVR